MSLQTTQQAATAAPGVQAAQQTSAAPASEQTDDSIAGSFQSLFDAGAFAPTDETGKDLTPEQQAQLERDAQGGNQQQTQDGGQQTDPSQQQTDQNAQQQTQDEGQDFESLDAYLTDQKLDRDSFYSLPVTVKVDGHDQAVPLAEVVKGYQLASASYNRMNELSRDRQTFTTEQQQVRGALGVRIQQIEAILNAAQNQLMGDYNSVTQEQWAKLRTENPGDYAAAVTEFNARQQALKNIFQQVQQAKTQETQAATQSRQQVLQREQQLLLNARPEWRDPVKGREAREGLLQAGRQLGFSDAELGGITDHRQLLALDLVARALKNQASRPGVLKRVRAAPKMAPGGTRQVRDPKRAAITNAATAWARSGFRDDDAAAALFEQVG